MSSKTYNFWLDRTADEVFNSIDTNKDNNLSKAELKRALEANEIPTSSSLINSIFDYCDQNKDGIITRNEFIKFTNDQNTKLNNIFTSIDTDNSGYLTTNEVKSLILGMDSDYQKYKLDKMIQKLDKNRDGKIDKSEFMRFYHMIPVNNIKMTFDFFSKEGIDIGESFTIPNEKDDDPKDSKKYIK